MAITNAVLSRLDIDELVSEVAKEIHRYFRIDAISVVLRSDRGSSTSIPRIILTPATRFTTRARWMKPALTERVFKSKEMLLLNLHEHDTRAV